MKHRIIISGLMASILLLGAVGCSTALANTPIGGQDQKGSDYSDVVIPNRDIVENFIKTGSTFRFDGIDGTVKLINWTADAADKNWQFTVAFQTRHAGHGDRTGHMLAQVITNHTAVIVATDGEITSAVCDNSWDMLKDAPVSAPQPDVQAQLGQAFNLPVGKTAAISGEDLVIRFVEVTSDSRSPKGVQTIWAGEANIRIQVTYQGATSEVTLTEKGGTDGLTQASVLQYTFGFQLKPYPEAGSQPASSDYTLVMTVSK